MRRDVRSTPTARDRFESLSERSKRGTYGYLWVFHVPPTPRSCSYTVRSRWGTCRWNLDRLLDKARDGQSQHSPYSSSYPTEPCADNDDLERPALVDREAAQVGLRRAIGSTVGVQDAEDAFHGKGEKTNVKGERTEEPSSRESIE